VLGYASRQEHAQEMRVAADAQKVFIDKIAARPLRDIAKDPELMQFAVNGGDAAFKVNCATCHATGAMGRLGYPNLNDDDWLWGGTLDHIYQTIAHGVRNADPATRFSEMPAFKDMLQPKEVKQVSAYVISLTGTPVDAGMVEPGKAIFEANCASCHGEKADGNKELGAPNLADAIWLKGQTEEAIARQVASPRHGVMPAWSGRLSEATIKQLSLYVHSLGGGE